LRLASEGAWWNKIFRGVASVADVVGFMLVFAEIAVL
jgi:hypothetical protein